MTAIVEWFALPLQFEFMQRALLVSVVAGVVCAVLSCWMTLTGWSLLGDAVSHAVLPGVVLSYLFGFPFALGALVFGAVQSNTITGALANSAEYFGAGTELGFSAIVGVGLVFLTGLVIFGGVRRIANTAQALIPFFAALSARRLCVRSRVLALPRTPGPPWYR